MSSDRDSWQVIMNMLKWQKRRFSQTATKKRGKRVVNALLEIKNKVSVSRIRACKI